MALKDKSLLKSQAQVIRSEVSEGMNTAERIGKVLEELVDNTDISLTAETDARSDKDNQLTTDIDAIRRNVTGVSETANKAKADVLIADAKAVVAQNIAYSAKGIAQAAKDITDGKGVAGGIAPLDANGFIPSQHLPGYVDDVVEFNAMVDNVTTQNVGSLKKSTDAGCMVVYDKTRNRFLLAVSKEIIANSESWDAVRRPALANKVASSTVTQPVPQAQATEETPISTETRNQYWSSKDGRAKLAIPLFDYYVIWAGANLYGEDSATGRIPNAGKIYTCTSDNKTFRWSGSALVIIGSDLALGRTSSTAFPGDAGVALEARVDNVTNVANELTDKIGTANGIAPLDDSCKIPISNIPNSLSVLPEKVAKVEGDSASATQAANMAVTSAGLANTAAYEAKSSSALNATAISNVSSRVTALEEKEIYEVLENEAEYESRKAAGTLDATKLYLIQEQE